jgi:excisionase family DNA binding protein
MTAVFTPEKVAGRRLGDVKAVAEKLDCSQRHVYRMADGGRMPAPLRLGSLVRWDLDAIDRWISDGCPTCRKGGGPMKTHTQDQAKGERLKAGVLALLADHREAVVRWAQRALLAVLLQTGSATVDAVWELVALRTTLDGCGPAGSQQRPTPATRPAPGAECARGRAGPRVAGRLVERGAIWTNPVPYRLLTPTQPTMARNAAVAVRDQADPGAAPACRGHERLQGAQAGC